LGHGLSSFRTTSTKAEVLSRPPLGRPYDPSGQLLPLQFVFQNL